MKFRLEKRRENDAIFAQYVLLSVAYVLTCYVWVKLSNSISLIQPVYVKIIFLVLLSLHGLIDPISTFTIYIS